MKFMLLSDVHLEFGGMKYRNVDLSDVDAILLAGDIGVGAQGWAWAERTFPDHKVLYTPGNHEGYGGKYSFEELDHHLRAKESNVVYMQNDVHEFPDEQVVVLGCTLWTDYELNGTPDLDMIRAQGVMNDFRMCDYRLGVKLRPEHCRHENLVSKQFLTAQIKKYRRLGWKIVVMTHHGVCQESCEEEYRGSRDNAFYVNTFDRDYDFEFPDFWVHGHVHNSNDYEIAGCRVFTNPRGYVDRGKPQNPEFNPTFTFEVKNEM